MAALGLLIILLELLYIAFRSPRFAVAEIQIRGDARLAEEVAERLHLPANTNIFLAPTGALAAQAKRVSAVREVSISRDWQRRLIVTLERREAMAVIRGTNKATLIDPSGVLFSIRNEWAWGVPELAAPHLSAGDTTSPEARAELATLLEALRALAPNPQLRIARLTMDRNGDIETILDSQARVRLGSTDRLAIKTKLLIAVLDQLGAERIAFLNLSNPSAAYWRERKPEAPETPVPPSVR